MLALRATREREVSRRDAKPLDDDGGDRSVQARTEGRIDVGEVVERCHIDDVRRSRRAGNDPRARRGAVDK